MREDVLPPLAQRLAVPQGVRALLFDMDGVLIDSLSQDYWVVDRLLQPHRPGIKAPSELVRRCFPLALDDFWAAICTELAVPMTGGALEELVRLHEEMRRDIAPVVHKGIVEILEAAQQAGLRCAVVSNNPEVEIGRMLASGDILKFFDIVVGNDGPSLARKPAPDPYLAAVAKLGFTPAECLAIEDSVLGLQSAHDAGCHTVGVATGASSLEAIVASGFAHELYPDFRQVLGEAIS